MSNLVVVAFNEPHEAEEVRLKLQKLQSKHLLDLADVVVAVRDKAGKAKLHYADNRIADDLVFQGFCGSLANLILANAATGAASRALTDVGIDDRFMKTFTSLLAFGSSVLFVFTRPPTPSNYRLLEVWIVPVSSLVLKAVWTFVLSSSQPSHRPRKFAFRFSLKACLPSAASSVAKQMVWRSRSYWIASSRFIE